MSKYLVSVALILAAFLWGYRGEKFLHSASGPAESENQLTKEHPAGINRPQNTLGGAPLAEQNSKSGPALVAPLLAGSRPGQEGSGKQGTVKDGTVSDEIVELDPDNSEVDGSEVADDSEVEEDLETDQASEEDDAGDATSEDASEDLEETEGSGVDEEGAVEDP